jgi:hypothetical protein
MISFLIDLLMLYRDFFGGLRCRVEQKTSAVIAKSAKNRLVVSPHWSRNTSDLGRASIFPFGLFISA